MTQGTWPPSQDELERLGSFIASVKDCAIYMLSPEGTITSWNAGAQRFKGYEASEILGQHFSVFYTPEDRDAGVPRRALDKALAEGKFEAEGWRVRKDGSRFWASVLMDPVRDQNGRLVGFAKITRDITEKMEAQRALAESEHRFRLLVESVTDYAIYMLSPEGLITNWNEGARRIKGYEASEVVGTDFERFYTEEDRAAGKPRAALAAAREHGRFEAEARRVRKDGTVFWAHVVLDAIRNAQGDLIGFAKVTRDITERIHAQTELEKAREALHEAQKLEALGKVTGGVAHDFNNLLAVMSNGIALLRRYWVAEARDGRVLDTMEQAVRGGAAMIRQLLAFARQQPLQKEHANLNQLVQGFEPVLRQARAGAAELTLELGDGLPLVQIDVAQVQTALLNLVVNAYDATPAEGRVTISTRAVDVEPGEIRDLPAGHYACVTVTDTGLGMSKDVLQRAIEPFFTTKPAGKGTGLGLSQVYGLVQQSGGRLTIQSREGQGTRIAMYFPAAGHPPPPSQELTHEAEVVLVVDDQPELLDMTVQMFDSLGFVVLRAASGEEALERLKTHPVHVLFSDVVMGAMSGVDLAIQARALVPGIHVILTSGNTGSGRPAPSGHRLEGFEFLPKPYRHHDVVRKLRPSGSGARAVSGFPPSEAAAGTGKKPGPG